MMVKEINKRHNITFIELSNGSNLRVILSTLGASIVEIYFNNDLLTMSAVNKDDLERKDVYYGKTIGPICNRIEDGLLVINSNEYHLPLNEKKACNHSGTNGLSNKIFNYRYNEDSVEFYLDYEGDLPGKTVFKVVYKLINNTLRVEYDTVSNEDTIIALTNHVFFCLGEKGIDNLSLVIPADYYVKTDQDLIPRSKEKIDDYLDFNKVKKLSSAYDHCYFLKDPKMCCLKSDKYQLTIKSNYECLQIYTDNFIDDVNVKNTSLKTRRGIAIEPEDSLLNRPIIRSGNHYQRYIEYIFTCNGK